METQNPSATGQCSILHSEYFGGISQLFASEFCFGNHGVRQT